MAKLKSQYLYRSHLGGYYLYDDKLTHGELYCDECGDCDWCLGYVQSIRRLVNLLLADLYWDDPITLIDDKDVASDVAVLQDCLADLPINYRASKQDLIKYNRWITAS